MAKVWVKGYVKDDGTKVSGYYRDTRSAIARGITKNKNSNRPVRKDDPWGNKLYNKRWDGAEIVREKKLDKFMSKYSKGYRARMAWHTKENRTRRTSVANALRRF